MTDSYLWGRDYTTGSYLHSGSDNLLGYIPANSDCFFFSCRELTCQETKHKEPHPPKGFSQWRIHPHLLPTWLPQANSILAVAQLLHLVVSSDSSSYSVIRNDFISHPPPFLLPGWCYTNFLIVDRQCMDAKLTSRHRNKC